MDIERVLSISNMTVGKSISGNLIPNAQERVEKWSREARYGFELFCDVWRKIANV